MKLVLLLLLVGLWQTNGQQDDCFGEGSFSTDIDKEQVNRGAEEFGLKIFRNIATSYSTASFIMSPYSIWSVLKLAYYGSAGITETELQKALGVPSKRDAFWASHLIDLQRQLAKDDSLSQMDTAYFADDVTLRQCAIGKVVGIKRVNFKNADQAAKIINDDISTATKGLINNFINAGLIRNARFLLINAIYFKGKWVNQFDKSKTEDAPFFDEQNKALKSPARMMEARSKFAYAKSAVLGAEVVELPYENSSFAMLIILPNQGTTVNSVLERLTWRTLKDTKKELKSNKIVTVNLPAFNFTTKIDRLLRESLTKAGIVSLFSAQDSDMRNYVPDEKVFVNNALHQATIKVDEEGTVAAAVTGLVVTRTGVEKSVVFTANRPFLFLLRDNAVDVTFFIGVYRNPDHSTAV